MLHRCKRFAASDDQLRNCPFVESPGRRWLSLVVAPLERCLGIDLANRSFSARLIRKLSSLLLQAPSRWQAHLSTAQLTHFDIYHSPVFAFPEAVRRSAHLKKFLTVYDLTHIKLPQHALASTVQEYRHILNSVPPDSYFLCISEHTKNDWCEYMGVPPERCFVTPLAAGEQFTPCLNQSQIKYVQQKYKIPPGRYYLSVSTLEPRKNLLMVIRAFIQLWQQTKDSSMYLVLAGRRGWHEEEILRTADASQAREQIIFTGYVAEADLSALYSGALAFVYMSFYEGFGLPPLEAMQCGAPTVTSNVSSLPEVVGTAGLMLDPRDEDGLCAAMLQLRDDESLRRTLRQRSLERARLFTWQRCLDLTLAAYRSAVDRG